MSDNVFRMKCWFEGHVQGVGFRYQTISVAKGFEVTGTVQNLVDGRVYLYAEGEESEVTQFQQEVAAELSDYIRETEIKSDFGPRLTSNFHILQ
ncbi:MAG: acylphosphatase [Opitutales bacterium]|jgi:acylphosphatase|nr:acylphosphatase [Opitutales bacterium]MDP4693362.1 acylphosphatase [Opitutales bacterium]MDP4883247.1 acylphosphatase [Opitutales bacterium]